MIVFMDKNFVDDNKELFTDAYKFKLIDGVIYEVEGKTVAERFDGSSVNIGANASAEEQSEGTDEAVKRGPDFAIASRLKLVEPPLTKKQFMAYLKGYLKTLDFPEDEKDALKKCLEAYLKTKVFPNFSKFDQYVAEDLIVDLESKANPMVCLVNYREETDNPYMVAYKHGLIEMKQ